jgi:hypothetical protein
MDIIKNLDQDDLPEEILRDIMEEITEDSEIVVILEEDYTVADESNIDWSVL